MNRKTIWAGEFCLPGRPRKIKRKKYDAAITAAWKARKNQKHN